jgi:hypothetical protein
MELNNKNVTLEHLFKNYKKSMYFNSSIEHSEVVLFFSGVGLSPLGTAANSGLLYKSQMTDEGDCGAIGGMKVGRGNRSTRRKPAPAPLCPPQISYDQTRARTRAAAVGSQRLIAWAMARPEVVLAFESNNAGLKKLSQILYMQSNDSSAYLNATTCFLKYVLKCERHLFIFLFSIRIIRHPD